MPWVLRRQVSFLELSPPPFCILYVWCLFQCVLSTFRCHTGCHIPHWGLNCWVVYHCNPIGVYPWQAYVQPGDGHWSTPGMHRVAAPSTTLSRGSLMLLSLLFLSHPVYMMGHTDMGAWQRVTQSLHILCMVGRGLLFEVWFHPMTWSTLNLQWVLNLVILV